MADKIAAMIVAGVLVVVVIAGFVYKWFHKG